MLTEQILNIATYLGILSIITFLMSIVLIPWFILHLPDTLLLDSNGSTETSKSVRQLVLKVCKNTTGCILLLAGIIMIFLPGQGLLTIIIALSLLDFPRRNELMVWLISQPNTFKAINWIRIKADASPLRLPAERD